MAELLYNIKNVFDGYLNNGQQFYIPEYQRGYKWNPRQINQLLEDINEFKTEGDDNLFYCLQNITLFENESDRSKINVVDGQQRLTTIILLLTYLDNTEKIKDKLIYAVREPSNDFLQSLINLKEYREKLFLAKDFDNFLASIEDKDYDYQDIYFMFNAYKSFDKWFKLNNTVKPKQFLEKLLLHVKLIVNRVEGVNEQELFMNLNADQVHLDGSDLVRAILITRVAKQEMEEYDSENVEDIVRLNERRIRIGWELDELNSWWSQPMVKEYFKSFSNIQTSSQETIKFDEYKYPINLLYKIWVESKGEREIKLNWFESKNTGALELYTSIIKLHRVLKDWFQDRFFYHFLGYLFNHGKPKFKEYWTLWNKTDYTRGQFKDFLKKEAQKVAFGDETTDDNTESGIILWLSRMIKLDSNSINWYESDKLEKILILLDIIEHSEDKILGNPLPFLKSLYFKNQKEDKEHIYPGTPKDLDVMKNLTNPIESINNYINKLNIGYSYKDLIKTWEISESDWMQIDLQEKENRRQKLKAEIHIKRPINSIGNLVLLHSSINRSFGNDYYSDKREMVINNTITGKYVRQHTLNVFVKSTSRVNLNDWTMNDITENAKSTYDTFVSFFNVEFNDNRDEEI
jgi:uncharacterized protein with ParB-like and HNH nuclease domain